MAVILTVTQMVNCRLQPVDAKGNPATLDGVPTWQSSDETIATVDVADDGLSAYVVAVGKPGTVQVSATGDADLDTGETREITGVLDVEVKAGEAVSMGMATDAPVEQTGA